MEEAAVIASIKAGNVDAFTEIVENYQIPIVRYLCRLVGDEDIARDLAQDTFIQAFKGILKTSPDLKLRPWLFKIATNNARQYYRRKRIINFIPFGDHRTPDFPSQYRTKDIEENIEVRSALRKVPLNIRTCLVLHFVEGFKYKEMADALGISEDAVRMRVTRGRELFRQAYTGGGQNEM
ncbi:MAG: hypothetical protein A2158_05710 [Chloroflexi bacterium RBG_13_46_14]|nr:MAG: hypothetical protein A2158_05710 [Chloroflexi bacterium RBG_13_46_14]